MQQEKYCNKEDAVGRVYMDIQQVNLRPDPEMGFGSVTLSLQHLRVVKCLLQEWNLWCNGGSLDSMYIKWG